MDLDYTGLTEEQISTFIESVDLTVECDTAFTVQPTVGGYIIETITENFSATGYISGTILGDDINGVTFISHPDLIKLALEQFKKANGDLNLAAQYLFNHQIFE